MVGMSGVLGEVPSVMTGRVFKGGLGLMQPLNTSSWNSLTEKPR